MTNNITDLVEIFRLFIDTIQTNNDVEESYIDHENEPGQQFGEGNVKLTTILTGHDWLSGIRINEKTIDARIFQREVKNDGNLLLDMFNSNAIYLCEQKEMDGKVMKHMIQTGAYSFVEELHNKNTNCVRHCLNKIVEQKTLLLNDLLDHQYLSDIQVQQMTVKRSMVQMNYLYFLPDAREEGVPFQPVMICCLSPTVGIARYMHRLLQPIYDQVAYSTTFFKESNAVHALENYAQQGLLHSKTLFATLHVNDLCTIVPHEQLIEILQRFLNDFVPERQIQGVSIDTIIQLVRFVLQNQLFVFNNSIYRQIKGCGSNLPFNHLLANIYMFYWQEGLVKILVKNKEVFGRYFDELFFTWNKSKGDLQSFIRTIINPKFPTLFITTAIGKKVTYLDAKISHVNGKLHTRVHHDRDIEPRALPIISDRPPLIYSTLIHASLIRATLICSKVLDFQNECQDIQMIFRSNGFTFKYIQEHIEQFYRDFHVSDWKSNFSQHSYAKMRQQIIEDDQQRTAIKIKQRQEEQSAQKWYITSVLNGEALLDLQQDFNRLWDCYIDKERQFKNVNIEFIHRPHYPANTK